eukprot:TRINITY_DN13643_c0_g1_i1.p1 TRINITY_DN13643_c0_g1~~TRINITY_DN13643_c0_g1_i1.p1  ORF type:complete len:100 (-),score=6.61 TRINITY_DN13643_c0_g1_i1:17-316(-)
MKSIPMDAWEKTIQEPVAVVPDEEMEENMARVKAMEEARAEKQRVRLQTKADIARREAELKALDEEFREETEAYLAKDAIFRAQSKSRYLAPYTVEAKY